MSGTNELCLQVDDALAEILDGSAPAALFDHVAECDECRDKKHDAQRAAELVAAAGLDFRAPENFEGKLIAGMGERGLPSTSGTIPLAARLDAAIASENDAAAKVLAEPDEAPHTERMAPATDRMTDPRPAVVDPMGRTVAMPVASEPRVVPNATPLRAQATPAPARSSGAAAATTDHALSDPAPARAAVAEVLSRRRPGVRRSAFFASAAIAIAAAAAFGFYWKGRSKTNDAPDPKAPWAGSIASISRASADKNGGVEACDAKGACSAVLGGAAVKPGMTVKTDAKTRARIALEDGTEIALDRGTEIELGAKEARAATLKHGTLVADVAHLEGATAHIRYPGGDVEVVGTKLALTASEDRASCEVARGEVRISSGAAKPISVRAGEEATLIKGSEPVVASSSSISDTMEWSDKSPEEVDAPVLRGLGELRARKPGETKEKDHAVRLAKHSAKVRIVDIAARTEVDETFSNDTDQELEGIFRFPLPPGAQVERLALEVDGKLVDGAFVDRDRGAAIWRGVIQNAAPKAPKPKEEIIWVPGPWRDPALLEWQRGGRFELKIFPIPKHGSRRIVLAYTQTVDQAAGLRRFVLPLAHDASGTTKVDAFDLDVQVLGADKALGVQTRGYELASQTGGQGDRKTMHADAFVPAGDLTVEYALPNRDKEVTSWAYAAPVTATAEATALPSASPKTDAWGGGRRGKTDNAESTKLAEQRVANVAADSLVNDPSSYVAISIKPKLPRWKESKERVHAIVVDSSRSMFGERFARATRLAGSIVREMDRRDTFVLLACDSTCKTMSPDADVPGAAAGEKVERFLSQIEPDGGSDLAASVSAARAAAGTGRELRVVYLGDGTPTVGPTKAAHLEAATRQAIGGGEAAVIAVALGADADTNSLAALARGGGGVVVPYVPGQRVNAAALDILAAGYGQMLKDPEVELPNGLSQVTPSRLDPIRAGGETIVVARMSDREVSGSLKLKGKVGSERFEQTYPIKIVATSNAGNAFVPRLFAAAKITELEQVGSDSAKPMAIALSTRFSVASRFTSLLVLESEAMFKAFGVEHNAGGGGSFTGEQGAESASADGDVAQAEDELDNHNAFGGDTGKAEKSASAAHERGRLAADGNADDAPRRASGGGHASGGFAPKEPAKPSPVSKNDQVEQKAAPSAAPADAPRGESVSASKDKGGLSAAPAAPPPPPQSAAEEAPRAHKAPAKKAAGPAPDSGNDWDRRAREAARRSQNLVPMKKVFDRKTGFDAVNTLMTLNAAKLVAAEAASRATPDSRDRTVELYGLFATSGRLGDAQELTARWSGRDALDPDALLARADLAARQGDRARAIRILGGLVDVRPTDRVAQKRLAELHEIANEAALACEHRITLAEIASTEVGAVADAVRCARAQGMSELASLLELDAGEKLRTQIEVAAATVPNAKNLAGDVQVNAEWTGGEDLDISIVDAQGHRTSWMGTQLKNTIVSARDVTANGRESLAVQNLPAGNYLVEISRASGGDSGPAVHGDVTFKLGNETRKVAFNLTSARAEIGTVRVFFTSRLVRADQVGNGWAR